jgi:RNA 2',3'-cyclic 3'-phosphodiesterase
MQTYRTFIAIEVPAEIRRQIRVYIDQLRAGFPDVRASWSREDNLHLTLKFLGDVEVSRIPALSQACAEAAQTTSQFALTIGGCGTFPPHGKPKVLWIRVGYARIPPASAAGSDTEDPLLALHAAIEETCASAGFAREARPYHPHLTIARVREARDSRALSEHHKQCGFPTQTFTVSEVVVFRSELSSKGSQHTALSHHRLG